MENHTEKVAMKRLPIIFVTIGVPACGKSAFRHTRDYRDLVAAEPEPFIVLESDSIREELFGSEYDQSNNELVFSVLRDRLETALKYGLSVYVDATHAKRDWRTYIHILAEKYGARVIALRFHVPFLTLWMRDRLRKRHVGFKVLAKYFFGIQDPTFLEGFDVIMHVNKTGDVFNTEFSDDYKEPV